MSLGRIGREEMDAGDNPFNNNANNGNKSIEADDDDEIDQLDSITQGASSTSNHNRMGSVRGNIATVRTSDRTYMGENTLDEPVSATLIRDGKAVAIKVAAVLYPSKDYDGLRDWDLWGNLIFCLVLSLSMAFCAPENQSVTVFTGIFFIIWFGEVLVTLNIKLLGGTVSFFQSIGLLGYCLFPLVISGIVSTFVRYWFVRLPVGILAYSWSCWASMVILKNANLPNRNVLAVYPMFLFFFSLAWIIFISE